MGGRKALQRCCFSTFFNITTLQLDRMHFHFSFFTFHFFCFYSHFLPNVFLWTLSPISPTSQILFTFTLNFTKPFTPSSNTCSLSLSSHLTFLRNIFFAQYSSLLCLSERTFFLLLFFSFSHQHSLSHRCCRECTF